MGEFTTLGGANPSNGAGTGSKVIGGASAALVGFWAGEWLVEQWQVHEVKAAHRAAKKAAKSGLYSFEAPVEPPTPEQLAYARQSMIVCLDTIEEVIAWMDTDQSGCLSTWDTGDPTYDWRVAEFCKKYAPEVYERWQARNYPA